MGLRIICGRAGSGKTHLCLNEIKSNIRQGNKNPLVLLVPEQFTLRAEKDLVMALEVGGIIGTQVLSFRRLAFRVFNEAGGITYPHIHQAGKCMILHSILGRIGKEFKVFAKSASQQGFVNKLTGLITEFKQYNVTPLLLEDACNGLEEGSTLRLKIRELAQVYRAFEETIAERYRDTDDDLTLASEKLNEISLLDGASIWIDGFDGFTPQEYRVIASLLRKAGTVNITLCTDSPETEGIGERTDVFSPVRATCRKLVKLAGDNGINVETKAVGKDSGETFRFNRSRELGHLEQNLYSFPYESYREKTKDIVVFQSSNMFSEVEATAEDIVRLCRDCDMRYREIAVVTGNLDCYGRLVEAIFPGYGIPCFIDKKVDIINHPLVSMVLSMLEIFQENWSYESVFRYLKTGLTGIDTRAIDNLENYVLACGIRGSRWTDGMEWRMSPGMIPGKDTEEKDELLEEINRTRELVTAPLLEFREKTRNRNRAAVFCEKLYDFLCSLDVPGRMEEYINAFREDGDLDRANEYSQVWNIVMEVLDQVVEVSGEDTFGIKRFTELIKIGFSEYKTGLIPASLDQVLVGNIERSKSRGIKALYILGANDGVFPSPDCEEGILTDNDRDLLVSKGVELAENARIKAFEEQYLVYRTLTTPEKYLRISWAIADHEGRTLRPSMVISRLRRIFPDISTKSNILRNTPPEWEIERVTTGAPTFENMVSAFRRKADGSDISPVWREVYRWFISRENWKKECVKARRTFDYKNIAGKVAEERITGLYGNPVTTSVSRLEQYASCPFAFFIEYGLRAGERKEYALRPPDVGSFIHEAIERFSRCVEKTGVSWRDVDREWCSLKVTEVVEGMLREMQGGGIAASKRYTTLALRLKRVITRAVWLVSEHIRRSGFYPVDYEAGFGTREKYPPVSIELDSGHEIVMTGRIDRIDRMETEDGIYLRVVDYKSGAKDFRLSDVYYGLQIQLVAYLDAIHGMGDPGGLPIFPGGILYFRVDDPLVRSNGKISPEEIETAIMKKLKMKGLLLKDVKIIKEMDRRIEGSSVIIPATIKKKGGLGKNTSAATTEQFEFLRRHVRHLLKKMSGEIIKGNFMISPYKKKGTTSCKYCSFLPICQFDTALQENRYRFLHDKGSNEIWRLIDREAKDDGSKMDT